ncbi:hypothetical protein N1851_015424 [Merluccius polli]|uniref:Uncharacterized protein n=1 Tax=Merluccius polli TaxID=89951 RepID=A0AA47MS52_MERPO|nr:hypothetical protein N1851_015424 [Merluccius polli]
MADIQAMFHQVKVSEEDVDFLRFLWWPGGDVSLTPVEYRMTVHIFGAVSSPSCANYALRKTAIDNRKHFRPEVIDTILNNIYVDDCLKSVSTEDNAILLITELTAACQRGGFHLSKWITNSHLVLASISRVERAKEVKELNLDRDRLPTEKAPWGAVELCSINCGWDEEVPKVFFEQWIKWTADLQQITDFKVRRCIKPNDFGPHRKAQLHYFSDASEQGYGTVSHLRLVNDKNTIHVVFMMGKTRVAPLKKITIPRMELAAAVLATRVDKVLRSELQLQLQSSIFWTDRTITALDWS